MIGMKKINSGSFSSRFSTMPLGWKLNLARSCRMGVFEVLVDVKSFRVRQTRSACCINAAPIPFLLYCSAT